MEMVHGTKPQFTHVVIPAEGFDVIRKTLASLPYAQVSAAMKWIESAKVCNLKENDKDEPVG